MRDRAQLKIQDHWALSIQEKIRFEISEIPHAPQ